MARQKVEHIPQRLLRAARDATADDIFEITITERDNIGAVACDAHNCAAANVLQEFEDIVDAWVGTSKTYIEFTDGDIVRYRNPQALMDEIKGFDAGKGFPAGTYKFVPVSPSERKGERAKRGDSTAGSHTRGAGRTRRPELQKRRKPLRKI